MALGVSMLPDTNMDVYRKFRADTGRWPATWSFWNNWGGTDSAFPTAAASQLRGGTVPFIFWAPVEPDHLTSDKWTYNTIRRGDHDAYITQFAQDAKAYGGRVLLRFAHEMDGDWFPWGIGRFDNTRRNFILAWRHVYNIFKSVGARNVKFVWSPNGYYSKRGVPIKDVYPGDKYVDYLAISGFNWGAPKWQTMAQVLETKLKELEAVTKSQADHDRGAGHVSRRR